MNAVVATEYTDEVLKVAKLAESVLPLTSAHLTDEYRYRSLPLCVIDAVFSIGVRYGSVQQVVGRYCLYFGLSKFRNDPAVFPGRGEQESISSFCDHFDEIGLERMTEAVFRNRQRTSVSSGILKSEAALRFARVLRLYKIEYLQDTERASENADLDRDIRSIPGQRSGISLQYFWMLAGSDELVKPDRMILRFLERALGRPVLVSEAQPLLVGAVAQLKSLNPRITPRLLDYEIWKFQRVAKKS